MATTTSTTRKRTSKSATKEDLKETVKPVLQEVEDNASSALEPEKIRVRAMVEDCSRFLGAKLDVKTIFGDSL